MKSLALLTCGLLLSASALAGTADQISIQDPYIRLAPPNALATGAFMVIHNSSNKDVKLVKASNPLSKVTELHTHINDNGVMKMRAVPAVDIKAGGDAVLQPGGLHIMLIEMKQPLKEGDIVPLTLGFEDGSSKTVDAKVRPIAPMMQQEHDRKH